MTYNDVEKQILDIPKFAGKNTPEDTARLLELLTGGKCSSKIIHVAGTNGKGSVCAYLRSILMESGYRVGMFSSPHLITMRERICINNEMISEKDFTRIYQDIDCFLKRQKVENNQEKFSHPSFFEYLFLMAMVYFQEKKLDYIILETGLGGRLDATNCVKNPAVCIITKIGYDHMQYLGNTLSEIAGEKAGIIKKEVPVVFWKQGHEINDILTDCAEKAKSPTIIIGKDSILDVNIHNKSIDFSVHTGYYNYISLSLDTVALYQVENASLAVAAAEVLQDEKITPEKISDGLRKAHWPGRMEEICPGVFLDGAHNEDGIDAFLSTVKQMDCRGNKLLLFGVVADKQYQQMIQRIAGSHLFSNIAVTTLESDRSVSLNKLIEIWKQYQDTRCSFYQNAEEAYQYLTNMKQEDDIVYVAGSLYLVGQIESLIRRIPDD